MSTQSNRTPCRMKPWWFVALGSELLAGVALGSRFVVVTVVVALAFLSALSTVEHRWPQW